MTEWAEKQAQKRERWEQEHALRQKQRRRKRRCLQILYHLCFLAGSICFLALLFAQRLPLLLGALWLWTAGAWCGWALNPKGRSPFVRAVGGVNHYVGSYGNLAVALVLSAAALLFSWILLPMCF